MSKGHQRDTDKHGYAYVYLCPFDITYVLSKDFPTLGFWLPDERLSESGKRTHVYLCPIDITYVLSDVSVPMFICVPLT